MSRLRMAIGMRPRRGATVSVDSPDACYLLRRRFCTPPSTLFLRLRLVPILVSILDQSQTCGGTKPQAREERQPDFCIVVVQMNRIKQSRCPRHEHHAEVAAR